MENAKFIVSVSPHIHSGKSTENIMLTVFVSLLPSAVWGVYIFGWWSGIIIITSIFFCVLTEFVIQKLRKLQVTISDGSAALTGLLFALVLPPKVPLYIPIIGAIFAIGIVKQLFGGLGHNILNPALAARAFVTASWPVQMTAIWSVPKEDIYQCGILHGKNIIDALSQATPLNYLKQLLSGQYSLEIINTQLSQLYSKEVIKNLFLGYVGGCIGETSALLLLAGGIFLIIKKIISWHIPIIYILTVAIFTFIFGGPKGNYFAGNPLFHILAGGLFLGAFFMATDYVTTPMTNLGKIYFAIGAGILTSVIRLFGGYPEGVCYSILIMNSFTPMIDRFTKQKKFGYIKK